MVLGLVFTPNTDIGTIFEVLKLHNITAAMKIVTIESITYSTID